MGINVSNKILHSVCVLSILFLGRILVAADAPVEHDPNTAKVTIERPAENTVIKIPGLQNLELNISSSKAGTPVGYMKDDSGYYPKIQELLNTQIANTTYNNQPYFGINKFVDAEGFVPTGYKVVKESDVWTQSKGSKKNLILFGKTKHGISDKWHDQVYVIPIERIMAYEKGQREPFGMKKYWERGEIQVLSSEGMGIDQLKKAIDRHSMKPELLD